MTAFPMVGSVTINAAVRSYIFYDGTRATQNMDWEAPWRWMIRRHNAVDEPGDPTFTVSSTMPNSARFYSGRRAIDAQYVIQHNGPFDQKWAFVVSTQASMTVTDAYLNALYDKIYNKLLIVTPDGAGADTDVYIGPAGLATWNQVIQGCTKLGQEWNTGEYNFPVILSPDSMWSLYLMDPVIGFQQISMSPIYGNIGAWQVTINFRPRTNMSVMNPTIASNDALVVEYSADAFKVLGKLDPTEIINLIH